MVPVFQAFFVNSNHVGYETELKYMYVLVHGATVSGDMPNWLHYVFVA